MVLVDSAQEVESCEGQVKMFNCWLTQVVLWKDEEYSSLLWIFYFLLYGCFYICFASICLYDLVNKKDCFFGSTSSFYLITKTLQFYTTASAYKLTSFHIFIDMKDYVIKPLSLARFKVSKNLREKIKSVKWLIFFLLQLKFLTKYVINKNHLMKHNWQDTHHLTDPNLFPPQNNNRPKDLPLFSINPPPSQIKFQKSQDKKLSFNFTVAIKVKPKLQQPNASQGKDLSALNYYSNDNQSLILQYPQTCSLAYSSSRNRKFNFDSVFIDKSNKSIYERLIKTKLYMLKQNMNLTLLTYGITGSGKSYTIFGNEQNGQEGIALMFFEDVMRQMHGAENTEFSFSFMQIYNEQIHDLLKQENYINQTQDPSENLTNIKFKSLNVLEDSKGKVNIPDLTKVQIKSLRQLRYHVNRGNNTRACSSNLINSVSSRSHAVLQLYCLNKRTKIENVVTVIDLAGSERNIGYLPHSLKERKRQQQTLQKEGANINKSLLALGNCIKGLQSGQAHIPYRDSKLTRILKDDLSGKAHNIMIACVGRNITQAQETINTLQYASRAANIKVEKVKNVAKSHGFQCGQCYKQTSWRQVLQQMPPNLLQNQNVDFNKERMQENYSNFVTNFEKQKSDDKLEFQLKLSQCFSKFKKEILQVINGWSSSLDKAEKEPFNLFENCLFSNQSHSSQLFFENQIVSEKINEIFDKFEVNIEQLLQKNSSFSSSNQDMPVKNNRVFSETIKKKYQQNQFFTDPSKHITTGFKFLSKINVDSSSNLQKMKQQMQWEEKRGSSNVRKKFSIKNQSKYLSSAFTTNTTSDDILSHNSLQNVKLNFLSRPKTQRMKLDVEEEVDPNTYLSSKSTIIKKIEEAKRKFAQDIQITKGGEADLERVILTNGKNKNEEINKQNELPRKNEIYVSSFGDDYEQIEACC